MKSRLLGLLAAGLLVGHSAFATPINYGILFEHGGAAWFAYDSVTQALTDFSWNLGGGVGGIADQSNGKDLFDLLTVSGVGCGVVNSQVPPSAAACVLPFGVTGSAPGGGTQVRFISETYGVTSESIYPPSMVIDGCTSASYCGGDMHAVGPIPGPIPVPEPGTLALFGLGLEGLGLSRRRKA